MGLPCSTTAGRAEGNLRSRPRRPCGQPGRSHRVHQRFTFWQRLLNLHRVGHCREEVPGDVEAGMLGVNIGVAATMAFFPFDGVKDSFYGDLHATGKVGTSSEKFE